MKQLNVFESTDTERTVSSIDVHYWQLFTDGASRNNPGPAGVGIVINKDNELVEQHGFFVGIKTNNQAEYLALLIGLIRIRQLMNPNDLLLINSDSELLVRQIKGIYRIKNPDLKPLYKAVCSLLTNIQYDIGHVLRDKNKQADALANQGLDRKTRVPEDFLKVLYEYNISL